MGVKENLQKMVDRKIQEIEQLEQSIRDARLYLQGLQDAMKALPKDLSKESSSSEQRVLRPGTEVAKVRDILRQNQKPLHVSELLKLLGREPNNRNKLSLSGSLSGYVRERQIFTRPAPNTFGLAEFDNNGTESSTPVPVTFGKVS